MSRASIGQKLAKKIIKGKFFESGEWWPPHSTFRIVVNMFKYFEGERDGTETFVVEAKCLQVIAGGKAHGETRKVKVGHTRSQIIKMNNEAAAGNVVQFVGVALASLLGRDSALTWNDPKTVNRLMKHFGIKRLKSDNFEVRVSKLLEFFTGEDQPFSGVELILSTQLKPTQKGGVFTRHWYELPAEDDEPDDGDDDDDDDDE